MEAESVKGICRVNRLGAVGASPVAQTGKKITCNTGNLGLIPGWGRPPGGGHGNPLQYSCLESPMDREAWWATVHRVTKSWTRLSDSAQHNRGVVCPIPPAPEFH